MSHVRIEDGETVTVPNIFAVGRNYASHARELGNEVPAEPFFFQKATGSLWSGAGPLLVPFHRGTLHHEVEMVVLLGRGGEHFGRDEARAAVRAVGVGLDLTLRDVQAGSKAKGLPWALAKSFPGAAVVSRFREVAIGEDLGDLPLSLSVNGEMRQSGRTSAMIADVAGLLSFLSARVPLLAGDLLFTGTPEGVGALSPGDELDLRLGSIAALHVKLEPA